MKTVNPLLNKNFFGGTVKGATKHTTIEGTLNRTLLLLLLLIGVSFFSWQISSAVPTLGVLLLWVGLIGGLIIALVTVFKKEWAAITAPVYAGFEGLFLGSISQWFEAAFQNIVLQAVLITFAVALAMLLLYRTRIIKVTKTFRIVVVAATFGIMLVYLASILLNLFGSGVPYIHESGPLGIGFSLFVLGIASLNLFLDFDFIEKAAQHKMPKYMEWFGAFALLVTIIWIYIETLRLLAKLRSR